ncbi:response regulator, partial [bacterium]
MAKAYRILLVNVDSQSLARLWAGLPSESEIEFVTAANPSDLKVRLTEQKYDLVVVDPWV